MSKPTDLDAVQKLCDALPWPAPWTTRSFGVDCPKADDCGDEHECVEIESLDAYPDGQCVAQVIDCPGLDTFARPVAAFITAARTLVPQMAAEIGELRAERDKWRNKALVEECAKNMVQHTDREFTAACNRADKAEFELSDVRAELAAERATVASATMFEIGDVYIARDDDEGRVRWRVMYGDDVSDWFYVDTREEALAHARRLAAGVEEE